MRKTIQMSQVIFQKNIFDDMKSTPNFEMNFGVSSILESILWMSGKSCRNFKFVRSCVVSFLLNLNFKTLRLELETKNWGWPVSISQIESNHITHKRMNRALCRIKIELSSFLCVTNEKIFILNLNARSSVSSQNTYTDKSETYIISMCVGETDLY